MLTQGEPRIWDDETLRSLREHAPGAWLGIHLAQITVLLLLVGLLVGTKHLVGRIF